MDTRLLLVLILSPLLAWGSVPAAASPRAPVVVAMIQPDDEDADDSKPKDEREQNAGVVEGQVVSVDYQRGMIGLQTPRRGRVHVLVLPSTNIQGKGDSFHTIADIGRGSRLRVFLSRRAGQLIAQIIHLR